MNHDDNRMNFRRAIACIVQCHNLRSSLVWNIFAASCLSTKFLYQAPIVSITNHQIYTKETFIKKNIICAMTKSEEEKEREDLLSVSLLVKY
jgi:hypothetical protein